MNFFWMLSALTFIGSKFGTKSGCAFAAPYYHCQGIYYEPVQQDTTVVYVVQEIEEGADPYVEVME